MKSKAKSVSRPRVKLAQTTPGSAWGDDPGYSVADAAASVGVSRKAMYDYIAGRKIGHVCVGGQKFVRRSHIAAFLLRGEVKAV